MIEGFFCTSLNMVGVLSWKFIFSKMMDNAVENKKYNVLTCNSHEAYVWALSKVDIKLDIIDQLPGRYTKSWDTNIRPIPETARLMTTQQALQNPQKYDCFIGHSINDILLVKKLNIPKILLLHVSLFGYMAQENSDLTPQQVEFVLKKYLKQINGTVVAISDMKLRSWGMDGLIIPHYVDSDFFHGYVGSRTDGLRVVNQFTAKNVIINANLHKELEQKNPIKLVGFNPDIEYSNPSKDLVDLRNYYRTYRYFVHTAHPDYEDGYNLASLEAMAVGMPVITHENPSSPIINGVSGFISNDMGALYAGIDKLMKDQDLAQEMGAAARHFVVEHHSLAQFNKNWLYAIQTAIQHY